jgi:stage III sporulation protein AH
MKSFKRDAIVLTVVAFVCVAAYLNWSYGNKGDKADADVSVQDPAETAVTSPDAGEENDGGLYFNANASGAPEQAQHTEYFAAARINRRTARDEAVETLSAVNSAENASKEIADAALTKISAIAESSRKEAELESLIMAKGFSDCVVFISDEGVKVHVPAPEAGLSTVDVAKITDAVVSETTYKAADLRIVQVTDS